MKRSVQLYIEGDRVELFEDEEITINSSIQNIKDISKIFTDFTQSFSIPASPSNNVIMRHFYNSEVVLYENEFINPATRRNATIEIDGTFFKRGKIQLEDAKLENGEPYSYSITFYGDLVSLKDTFGELKLSDLSWDSLGHDYNYTEIKNRIEDGATDYDVRYPLISPKRYWQYNNTQTPDENIDTTQGAIVYTELFPAVKIKAIFNLLEQEFNITFNGGFLDDPKFNSAFTYFKNTSEFAFISPPIPLEFTSVYNVFGTQAPPFPFVSSNQFETGSVVFNADNSITLNYITYSSGSFPITDVGEHIIKAFVENINPDNVTYYIDVYRFNQIIDTIQIVGGGNQSFNIYVEENTNNTSLNSVLRFEFRSDIPVTCNITLQYLFKGLVPTGTVFPSAHSIGIATIGTNGFQDLSTSAPSIKIADYFANVLKLFNLTAYSTEPDVYQLETIEEWYNKGDIFDITEYTDLEKIDVKRIQLFKNIMFKYQQSKSITNRQFANIFMREYGDLSTAFDYEGGDYKIEVSFENLLFSKFTDTNLQVGYCLDENLNSYVPAPITLYHYTNKDCSFYLTDSLTNTDNITSYVPFGQDVVVENTDFSLNWGSENSTLLDIQNFNGLYNTYYKGYIENLYNPKNRELTIKTILPLYITTDLELNDRVIIRDKRYIINNIKTSLTSGEATLTLINDFRRMIADGVPPLNPPIKPDPSAQCLDVRIPFIKNAVSCTLSECSNPSVAGVTITPSTITQEQSVEICIPENSGTDEYIIAEPSNEIITTEIDSDFIVTEESEGTRLIIICVTYTLSNGDIVSNQIYIEQE